MQIHVQPVDVAPAARHRRCAAALLGLVLAPAPGITGGRAEALVSAWSTGAKSSVRLIAAPSGPEPRSWHAGVEIRLADGALTYWRTPGGAGVPPVFDFSNSVNVANVEVAYPAPTRIEEEGTEVYGYLGGVTFPLRLAPREADHPMKLALTLSYAVCERICVPARAEAVLELPPRQGSTQGEDPESLAIARAEASVPVALSDAERDALVTIAPVAGAKPPSWRVDVRRSDARDLFAEAADGWYFETRKAEAPGTFLIVEAETPAAAGDAPVPVTLTLTGPRRSHEFGVKLDSKAAER